MSKLGYFLAGAGVATVGLIGTALLVDRLQSRRLGSFWGYDDAAETSEESLATLASEPESVSETEAISETDESLVALAKSIFA
ncbi:MAG: hypothetical protein LBS60_05040 [Deltaproteobacteria bacterium]|jgi:hypothetical protein|nr:hypothetical protein [Deltaproteobacteria bacterium]